MKFFDQLRSSWFEIIILGHLIYNKVFEMKNKLCILNGFSCPYNKLYAFIYNSEGAAAPRLVGRSEDTHANSLNLPPSSQYAQTYVSRTLNDLSSRNNLRSWRGESLRRSPGKKPEGEIYEGSNENEDEESLEKRGHPEAHIVRPITFWIEIVDGWFPASCQAGVMCRPYFFLLSTIKNWR